jgi:hypothetical protein
MRKRTWCAAAGLITALICVFAGFAAEDSDPAQPRLRFVSFDQGLPKSGQWREGFRVADLNGDGHPDIVHGPPRKQPGPPVIFLGDGKGSWKRWTEATFPALPYDYGDVEVADFNRDGNPDLALAVHYRGIVVLTGDGHGNFSNSSAGLGLDTTGWSGFSSRAIRAVDWNGDGVADLAAVWEGPRMGVPAGAGPRGVVVFLNRGASGWSVSEPVLSRGNFSDSIALGDFDGDGHIDLASGSMVLGRTDLVNLWRPGGSAEPLNVPVPGSAHYVQAVAAGDFDQDGKDDLAVAFLVLEGDAGWHAELDVFLARPGGMWDRRVLAHDLGRNVAVALGTGHLRGRGAPDLVALSTLGETTVYVNDGRGSLVRTAPTIPDYGPGCRGAHLQLADLDGDGLDEIVSSFADEPSAAGCPSGGGFAAWKLVSTRK